jgi:two-component sensor histidine kinase
MTATSVPQGSADSNLVGNLFEKEMAYLGRRIEKLESEIDFRELLLEEIIHRTKNTIQLAVVMLREKANAMNHGRSRCDVLDIEKQVLTLCHAHDQFYRLNNTIGLSLSLRIEKACSSLRDSFGEQAGQIAFAFKVTEIPLQRHREVCVNLILQELVTNALKHAFPYGMRGIIMVNLGVDDHSICHLIVHDDGTGRPLHNQTSTGMRLAQAFASYLGGQLEITAGKGTTVEVSFPLFELPVCSSARKIPRKEPRSSPMKRVAAMKARRIGKEQMLDSCRAGESSR